MHTLNTFILEYKDTWILEYFCILMSDLVFFWNFFSIVDHYWRFFWDFFFKFFFQKNSQNIQRGDPWKFLLLEIFLKFWKFSQNIQRGDHWDFFILGDFFILIWVAPPGEERATEHTFSNYPRFAGPAFQRAGSGVWSWRMETGC